MDNPIFSIIIPVYNVENYLSRCLDSVLNSDERRIEVIVVDDGSTDSSSTICDDYSQKDKRVKVIHKKNRGVSSARNEALNSGLISGNWICFFDADDAMSHDFLLLDDSVGNADVIEKDFWFVSDMPAYSLIKKVNRDFGIRDIQDLYYNYVDFNRRLNALWNKIFRKELVINKRFDEHFGLGEDFLFFMEILPDIKSYRYCSKGYYLHTKRISSAASMFKDKREAWKDYYFNCMNKLQNDIDYKNGDCRSVGLGIMYDIYVRNMYSIQRELSSRQRLILSNSLREMKWNDLKFLSYRRKLRLYFWHLKEKSDHAI